MVDRLIELLKKNLKSHNFPEGIAALYLYGSILKENLRKDSDIDVGMLSSYKTSGEDKLGQIARVEGCIQSVFKGLGYNNEISVLDMRGKYVSVPLLFKVVTEGVLIYEKNKEERIDFENAIKGEYFDLKPYIDSLVRKKYEELLKKTRTY